jgi:hypothetical protein
VPSCVFAVGTEKKTLMRCLFLLSLVVGASLHQGAAKDQGSTTFNQESKSQKRMGANDQIWKENDKCKPKEND